jgi:hypothetical protein
VRPGLQWSQHVAAIEKLKNKHVAMYVRANCVGVQYSRVGRRKARLSYDRHATELCNKKRLISDIYTTVQYGLWGQPTITRCDACADILNVTSATSIRSIHQPPTTNQPPTIIYTSRSRHIRHNATMAHAMKKMKRQAIIQ